MNPTKRCVKCGGRLDSGGELDRQCPKCLFELGRKPESSILHTGSKLGPYEILVPIGEGGMGQVYRARDTRLGREVAIKISTSHFTERFEREARAIAALNHSNICQLYDIGPDYLVMELIDGPTLAEKMTGGPIPISEAIHIARQIADALVEAHSKGIIHRDLKPGNVKIKPDGTVKVLDFGLAKVASAVVSGSGSPSDPEKSPTISMVAATEAGVIMGTAAYMSPEQARGKTVDKRADIWAFGVVLFEMLTGKWLFKGEDASITLAAVIKEEPDYNCVPVQLRPLLQMCLRKDATKRLHDISSAKLMLDQVQESSSKPSEVAPAAKSSRKMIWAAAAVLVLAIAAVAAWSTLRRSNAEQPMLQMEIAPPAGVKFQASLTPFALSPDGRKLVFGATGKDGKRMLWLRYIDAVAANALAGTENAELPFWSPDSRWIGFAADGKLQKIDINNGDPQVICAITGYAGGTWNSEGVIVFDQGGKPLQRVSAEGGNPTPILMLDASRQERVQDAPYFLPDGRHLLYLSLGKKGSNAMLASLDGKLNRVLIQGYTVATYAPNPRGGGWILYNPRGQLLARPFDLGKLNFTGQPTVIADGVGEGRWWYASATGLLAFRGNYGTQYQLGWFGRDGRPQGTVGDPGLLAAPRISPDQKTVAFQRADAQNTDVWTFDLTRSTTARLTSEPDAGSAYPVWSFDGKSLLYASAKIFTTIPTPLTSPTAPTQTSVVERSANGVGKEKTVTTASEGFAIPTAVSHDGRWLVTVGLLANFAQDSGILIRSRDDASKVVRILQRGTERDGSISPDGRWLLYSSLPASRREILVQSVPKEAGGSAAEGKWQISTAGGGQPAWRADGKEIFYVAPDGMMMAVPVESGESFFRPGAPKPLFQTRLEFDPGLDFDKLARQYDVTPDGQRFLLNQHVADSGDTPITVVANWPKLLEKRLAR